MLRVPPASREVIPEHLRNVFDSVVEKRKPEGMHATLLYSPEACVRAHHWVDYLRNDTGCLPKPLRELAMLVVARERDCQYIWNAHADMGRKAGLSSDLVSALRDKKLLPATTKPEERALIAFGQEYYRTARISQKTFDQARDSFGVQGVAELTMLMGFYAMLAFNAAAFNIEVPAGSSEPLLPI